MSSVWILTPEELETVSAKPAVQRLGFAIQLRMYGLQGRFFETVREVPVETIETIASALGRPITDALAYEWEGRTGRRHREEIQRLGQTKRLSAADREQLSEYLQGLVGSQSASALMELAHTWCRERGFRPPAKAEMDRLIRSLRRDFEAGLMDKVTAALSPETAEKLEASLVNSDGAFGFDDLKADPGRAGLENLVRMANLLKFIRSLKLPRDSHADVDVAYLELLRRRVSAHFSDRGRLFQSMVGADFK